MNILPTTERQWGRWLLNLSLFFVTFVILLLVVGRVLLPQITQYHTEIEKNLSRSFGVPVQFQHLNVTWHGWKPRVTVDNFQLGISENHLPWAQFDKGFIELNLLQSLLRRRLVASRLRATGLHLTAVQEPSGRLRFGPESSDPSSLRFHEMARRFSDLHALDLIVQQITIRPAAKLETKHVIRDMRITLRRDKQMRRLALGGELPERLGQQARAVLKWQGNIHDVMAADISFYIRGEALQLANWPLPEAIVNGEMPFFEAWGNWGQGKVQTLDGRVQLNHLTPPASPLLAGVRRLLAQMPSLFADFSWRRRLQGWDWQGNLEGKDERGLMRLQSAVQLQLKTPSGTVGTPSPYLEGYSNNLRLDDIATLINPLLQENSPLATMKPRGHVSALAFRVPLEKKTVKTLDNYTLVARFRDVATQPWQRIPGVQGLQGVLTLDQKGGRVELDSRQVRLTGEKLLRTPISLDRLMGPIRWWYKAADGFHLTSTGLDFNNEDFKAHLQGQVALLNAATSPYLNLQLTTQALRVDQVRRYLPMPLMHPKLSAWLNRALVGGRVTKGTVIWQGYVDDFPFDNGQGLFQVRLKLRDAILDYAHRWPRVEALNGEVLFRNRALQVNAVEGKIFDVDIKQVTAQIDDLSKGILDIEGRVQGLGMKMVNFLKTGPLAKTIGKQVQAIQVMGNNNLDLHLKIPLRKVRSLQVQGAVHFAGGQLTLPQWKLNLTRIYGAVEFTRAGLQARDIKLALRGQPAKMDITTRSHKTRHGRETRFIVRGRFGVQTLLGRHESVLKPYLNGESHWRVVVKTPSTGNIQVELTSDLQGMAVNLPEPLVKTAQQNRPFIARIEPQSDGKLFCRLTYGSSVQTAVELTGFPETPQLTRGELRIGSGVAQLPKQPGLMVIAHLPRFALATAIASGRQQIRQWPVWLREIDIRFDELALMGQRFAQVRLTVTPKDDGLALQLASKSLAGRVYLPAQATSNTPIGVQLQRLRLSREDTPNPSPGKGIDPHQIPPLWMSVEDLMLDDRSVGELRLSLMPEARGLRIKNLQLSGDEYHITASGDWWYNEPQPVSHLKATLTAQNLGKTLRAFGYEDALKEGEAKANLAIQWAAPFPAITPELIEGDLTFTIAQGRLLDVEPGLGRLVGLLNIGSLSRRLQLDFSDLFKEGLGFDQLSGTVRFAKGHAYNNVAIEAPAAQVKLTGRIGFQERDYRQTVTVTPQVGSPLAIAGAIAGGPAVGAAVLFAESIFKPEIDQITRYQYLVTGSWDDPVIQPRKAPVVVDPYSMRSGG
jgi:uncharacterized protein (TIGR02099 family)